MRLNCVTNGLMFVKMSDMKKVLFALLVVLCFASQAVAQEYGAWFAGHEVEMRYVSGSELKTSWLPKGYVIFGADGFYAGESWVVDGYIYADDGYGEYICRFRKSQLTKKVTCVDFIPLEYGNGKDYKLEGGMSFKIVPFKPNGKAKYSTPEDRKFINSKSCYVLILMNARGDVAMSFVMKKAEEGFIDACLIQYEQPMKVNKQGLLLTSGTFGFHENTIMGQRIKWILDENRLVLYSGTYIDYSYDITGDRENSFAEAWDRFCVAPAYKVLNPAVTDRGLYDVIGAVKEVKEGWHDAVKFSKTGKVLSSKKDVVRRDKNGRLIEWKIYEKMSEPQYPTYHEKVWKYDSNGNVIYYGESSDFADGYANHILYECDKEGRVVKQIVPMEEENPECVTECIREGTDTITYRYLQFDKYGNWIKRSCINSGICEDYEIGKTTWHKFTYEETCERIYDEKGNWVKMAIKRRATDNNKDNYYNKEDNEINPKEETRSRTIKYYEDTYD